MQDDQLILLNEDLLKIYGADRWCGSGAGIAAPTPVKAGDVITAAKPFVYALATSSRGRRCDLAAQNSSNRIRPLRSFGSQNSLKTKVILFYI